MQKRKNKIVKQYFDSALNAIVTVYAAKTLSKSVTATANRSIKHYGRTNVYGVSV